MKKICFILDNMCSGGAERVALNLINNLSRDKYEITLYLKQRSQNYLDYLSQVKSDVTIKYFKNNNYGISGNFFDLFEINQIFKKNKFDIVFSQLGLGKRVGIVKKIFLKNNDIKFVYRETNLDLFLRKDNNIFRRMLSKYFNRFIISNFDKVIAQSYTMQNYLLKENKLLKNKIEVINNPCDFEVVNQKKLEKLEEEFDKNKINLIAIGRLENQKGFDMLIETLSKIRNQNYILRIFGEGSKKEILEKMIKEKKLTKKIFLCGMNENPYKFIKNSDFLISSSRYEGLSNVVIEATVLGVPVIANSYIGVEEIIKNGLNGEIIDIKNSKLLETVLQKKYNKNIIKEKALKFNNKVIVKKYEEVF
ncbi:MAG: glycosyltransferase [Cetobacterium sp.]